MRKVIKNKIYDTETAAEIGSESRGLPGDLDYSQETLYRKKTGEYFLHGQGGPRSRYARQTGNNQWSSGELITPMDYDAAREWAGRKLKDTDAYLKEFGAVTDEEGKVCLSVWLPADLDARIRQKAREDQVTISEYVARILEGGNGE